MHLRTLCCCMFSHRPVATHVAPVGQLAIRLCERADEELGRAVCLGNVGAIHNLQQVRPCGPNAAWLSLRSRIGHTARLSYSSSRHLHAVAVSSEMLRCAFATASGSLGSDHCAAAGRGCAALRSRARDRPPPRRAPPMAAVGALRCCAAVHRRCSVHRASVVDSPTGPQRGAVGGTRPCQGML